MQTTIDVTHAFPNDGHGTNLRRALDAAEWLAVELAGVPVGIEATVTATDGRGRTIELARWSQPAPKVERLGERSTA